MTGSSEAELKMKIYFITLIFIIAGLQKHLILYWIDPICEITISSQLGKLTDDRLLQKQYVADIPAFLSG